MKSVFLYLPLLLVCSGPLHAADLPEFERLQGSYQTAVERATKPISETYLIELEKLRDSYTRAGNLNGANVVQAEITGINQALAFAKTSKKSPTAVVAAAITDKGAATMPELRWFVGKTWLTDAQTKWSFEKDGTGAKMRGDTKVVTFTWRLLPSGLIELSERTAPGKPVTVMFLRFKSKSEAWFGTSETTLNARLRYE